MVIGCGKCTEEGGNQRDFLAFELGDQMIPFNELGNTEQEKQVSGWAMSSRLDMLIQRSCEHQGDLFSRKLNIRI